MTYFLHFYQNLKKETKQNDLAIYGQGPCQRLTCAEANAALSHVHSGLLSRLLSLNGLCISESQRPSLLLHFQLHYWFIHSFAGRGKPLVVSYSARFFFSSSPSLKSKLKALHMLWKPTTIEYHPEPPSPTSPVTSWPVQTCSAFTWMASQSPCFWSAL